MKTPTVNILPPGSTTTITLPWPCVYPRTVQYLTHAHCLTPRYLRSVQQMANTVPGPHLRVQPMRVMNRQVVRAGAWLGLACGPPYPCHPPSTWPSLLRPALDYVSHILQPLITLFVHIYFFLSQRTTETSDLSCILAVDFIVPGQALSLSIWRGWIHHHRRRKCASSSTTTSTTSDTDHKLV